MILGLTLSMMIGPVFFALIETSMRKGLREGAKMAIGINISDWVYAAVAVLGIGGIVSQIESSNYFTLAGGVVLILFGLFNLLPPKKGKSWEPPERTDYRKRFSGLGKGFILNSLNPGTPIIWLAASSVGTDYVREGGLGLQAFFIASILLTILATDLAKVYLSRRFLKTLNPAKVSMVNKAVGVIMIVAGLRFIWMGLEGEHVKSPDGMGRKSQEAAISWLRM